MRCGVLTLKVDTEFECSKFLWNINLSHNEHHQPAVSVAGSVGLQQLPSQSPHLISQSEHEPDNSLVWLPLFSSLLFSSLLLSPQSRHSLNYRIILTLYLKYHFNILKYFFKRQGFYLTQNISLFIEILLGALERQNYTYAELSREKDFFSIIIC